MKMIVVGMALVAMVGCAKAAPQTQALVSRAVTLQQLVAKSQDIVISANKNSGVPTNDQTAKTMVVFRAMGGTFKELGTLLEVLDATDPVQSTTVRGKLQEVRGQMRTVLVLLGSSAPAVEELAKLFDNIDAIFAEIEVAMAAGRTSDAGEVENSQDARGSEPDFGYGVAHDWLAGWSGAAHAGVVPA